MEKEGKTWFWCPHHKMEGKYDGLYVTHKPEEHDEWLQRKNARLSRKKCTKNDAKSDESSNKKEDEDSNKLVISDSLKAALMTHMDISPYQVEALMKEAEGSADFH